MQKCAWSCRGAGFRHFVLRAYLVYGYVVRFVGQGCFFRLWLIRSTAPVLCIVFAAKCKIIFHKDLAFSQRALLCAVGRWTHSESIKKVKSQRRLDLLLGWIRAFLRSGEWSCHWAQSGICIWTAATVHPPYWQDGGLYPLDLAVTDRLLVLVTQSQFGNRESTSFQISCRGDRRTHVVFYRCRV